MATEPRCTELEKKSMPGPTELPQLVTEFVDMSKEYLRQETTESAKQLGRFAGYSIGAAVLFSIGTVLLAIAATRTIINLLPTGTGWEALGYVLGILLIAAFIAILAAIANDGSEPEEV